MLIFVFVVAVLGNIFLVFWGNFKAGPAILNDTSCNHMSQEKGEHSYLHHEQILVTVALL